MRHTQPGLGDALAQEPPPATAPVLTRPELALSTEAAYPAGAKGNAAVLLILGVLVVAGYTVTAKRRSFGLTSEIAAVVVFLRTRRIPPEFLHYPLQEPR